MGKTMKQLSDSDIKEFLETAPLYSWREFEKPDVNRGSLWINEIDSYCETCGQNRPFQDLSSRGSGAGMAMPVLKTGISGFQFTCVSCRVQSKRFLVQQVVDDNSIKFQKYGELPRKGLDKDRNLQKFFKEDRDNFEKATICLSHGYGIGAFAYFRRVIENNIGILLDLLTEDAQATEGSEAILNALAELRKESPMSKKIEIANNALPSYLKPDGLNPLGKLYQVLSEGVHTYSDEECLSKANAAKECVAFLVGELSARREHRLRFKKLVGGL